MTKIEKALALAKEWANDPAHGYDQDHRWGPDYDCSSFIISVWEAAGVPVKANGATYTGNMRNAFVRSGFEVVQDCELTMGAGLRDGDVLLNEASHAAMLINGYQLVQASGNELGGITGGECGDQTGRELGIVNWYSYPWDIALRYKGGEESPAQSGSYTVKPGDSWWSIAEHKLGSGLKMYELAEWNGRTIQTMLHPGMVLKLSAEAVDELETRRSRLEEQVRELGGRVIWAN